MLFPTLPVPELYRKALEDTAKSSIASESDFYFSSEFDGVVSGLLYRVGIGWVSEAIGARVVDSTLVPEFELVLFSRLSSPERSALVVGVTGFGFRVSTDA